MYQVSYYMTIRRRLMLYLFHNYIHFESHKLHPTTYALFKQFDISIVEGYRQWLSDQKIDLSDASFFIIIAICREGILIPALSGTPRSNKALIIQAVESQFKK